MNDFLNEIFVYFILLVISIPILTIVVIVQKRKEKYLENLAQKFNLEYERGEQIDLMRDFRSRLFKYAKTVHVKNVFFGEHKENKFTIFTKLFYSSKFSGSNNFTIASCEFKGTEFPHILLKSNKMSLYQKVDKVDTKIFLEQKYLENFDLYCPEDYEIEALQIFTEKLISSIQKISDNFSIEFGGDRLYVYLDKNIHNKKEEEIFVKLLDTVKLIIENTDGLLFRLNVDFEVLDKYYKK